MRTFTFDSYFPLNYSRIMGDMRDDDSIGKALLAERHRADEEFTRQSWRMLGWSFFLYAAIQMMHFLKQAFQGAYESQRTGGNGEAGSLNLAWEPSAGINTEVASTIVVGLAAFVVTINVAVFAARLGSPEDEASVLDLARWQRRMQNLAPGACYLALAVTYTQLIEEPALAVGLMFVSGLAIGASDMRVVGRLSALKMEVRSTKKFSNYADEQYDILLASLPSVVQQREGVKSRGWRAANVLSLLLVTVLVTLQALAIQLSWFSDPVVASRVKDPFNVDVGWLGLVWAFSFMTTGSALWAMVYAAAGRVVRDANLLPTVSGIAGVGRVARWAQWVSMVVALVFLVSVPAVAGLGLAAIISTGLVVLACFAVQTLLIRLAVRTGRGPGMPAVWLALADRAEDKRLAAKQYQEARNAHEEAEKRHKVLADAAYLQATRIASAAAAESGAVTTNAGPYALSLFQRILAAVNANGTSRQ